MANWLTTLRKKPKHVRDNIAFALSGGFSVVVCAVWFLSGAGTSQLVGGDSSPHFFQTFLGEFGKQVAAVRETIPKSSPATTSTTKSFPEAAPAATGTSSWAMASGTSAIEPPKQQIMIVTTSSTKATISPSRE